jgi:peptidoglycan hydrolase-like protein with peptidoglycan-binding domain
MNRILSALALLATVATTLAITPSPAAASYPICTTTRNVWTADWSQIVPYETVDDNPVCEMKYTTSSWRNPAVANLQETINQCYGPTSWHNDGSATPSDQVILTDLSVDGQYGPKTKAAVEAIQRYEHVGVDGMAGPQTRGAMLHYQSSGICRRVFTNPVTLYTYP